MRIPLTPLAVVAIMAASSAPLVKAQHGKNAILALERRAQPADASLYERHLEKPVEEAIKLISRSPGKDMERFIDGITDNIADMDVELSLAHPSASLDEVQRLTRGLEDLKLQPAPSSSDVRGKTLSRKLGKSPTHSGSGLWVQKKQFKRTKTRMVSVLKKPIVIDLSQLDPKLAAQLKQHSPVDEPPVPMVD